MLIKNVIFDVGNVLVRWAPLEVIHSVFPQFDPLYFYQKMRSVWIDLNLGKLSEDEAIGHYQDFFDLPRERLVRFMLELKLHQQPLDGSIALLEKLQQCKIDLFAITDNVKEIMEYHKSVSAFPRYFRDIVVSADIGVLKPDPGIYTHLLNKHALNASESIFIDDSAVNVEGAINVGMQAFQFTDYVSCEKQLAGLLARLHEKA